jgi:inositol oxygenase
MFIPLVYAFQLTSSNSHNVYSLIRKEGLDMIRYHSAYPMHDKGGWKHLLKSGDEQRLEWIRLFNRFDLYTKDGDNDIRQNIDELWPYYQGLLEKYDLEEFLKW